MSIRGTISAASWRGFQALSGGWVQQQVISYDYSNVGAVSGNGLYFAILIESTNSVDVYYDNGSSFILQQTIITNTGGLVNTMSMDITGNYLAIGLSSGFTGTTTGTVEIYTRSGSTWSLQQSITPNDAPQTDFGYGVSITGDATRLVVGNPLSASDTNEYGSIYIFTRIGSVWSQEVKKQLITPVIGDRLGTSVSINDLGNTIVAGAPSTSTVPGGGTTGKVVTFTRSGTTWTQQQIINRPTGANGRFWGSEVDISSDGLYLSGTCSDVGTPGVFGGIGVYYYSTTWTQQNYFISPYNNDTYFYPGGLALTDTGDYMFTAGDDGPLGYSKGFVYSRNNTVFSLSETLTPTPTTANKPAFGRVIGINGTGSLLLIIGFISAVPNELYIFRNT